MVIQIGHIFFFYLFFFFAYSEVYPYTSSPNFLAINFLVLLLPSSWPSNQTIPKPMSHWIVTYSVTNSLGKVNSQVHCLKFCQQGGLFFSTVLQERPRKGLSTVRACSAMSDSLQPHRLWPARLLRPWDFSEKNLVEGCHFLQEDQEDLPDPGIEPLPCFSDMGRRLYHWATWEAP